MEELAKKRATQLVGERKKLQEKIRRAEHKQVTMGTLVVELYDDLEHLKTLYDKERKISKEIKEMEMTRGPIDKFVTQP